jgi:hypothetical protein
MRTATPLSPDAAAPHHRVETIGAAAEKQISRRRTNSATAPQRRRPADASMPFLIRSTQRVIQHYRRLLAHPISDAERNALQERIRREERFLHHLCEKSEMPSAMRQTYAEAA